MDYISLLNEWVTAVGPSGTEEAAAKVIARAFDKYAESVAIDALQNVVVKLKTMRETAEGAPRIMVAAHQDEIGLITTFVEKDGAIRFSRVGGADPRTLPASRVWVHALGDDGQAGQPLLGVVGALPPHLLTAADRKRYYQMEDLFIDVGLPADEVARRVPTGTLVTLVGLPIKLANNKVASKTLDDRLCVAVMLRAAELLSRTNVQAHITFVASSQEEVGSYGADAAAYAQNPDIAIVLDVTMGKQGAKDDAEYFPLDHVAVGVGTMIHPELSKMVIETAREQRVNVVKEFLAGRTFTDTDGIQVTRMGIPTVLMGIPTANLHTPVELASLETTEETARLLTAFIEKAAGRFIETKGEWLCQWSD